jgi:ABC-type transport system substrate-binding protein
MIGLPESHVAFADLETKINKPGNRYYADDEEIQQELNQAGFTIETTLYPEDYSGVYLAKA